MQKISILYIFLCFSWFNIPLFGQDAEQKLPLPSTVFPWQEQILHLVDVEDLGEAAYNELLEELSELVLWTDTTTSSRRQIKQQLILSSNRCLNKREGYKNHSEERKNASKAYLGDPWHQSIRYRLQNKDHWQAGLSVEKDPGEAWQQKVPFFDSWHAYVRYQSTNQQPDIHHQTKIMLTDAIIGHYKLRIGHGLTMNQSFSLGKQYYYQQITQRTNRFSPFASTAESNYMQGAAFDVRIGRHIHVLPYFSMRQIDGNLSKEQKLTTLYTDGMHRTMNELSHKNASWQMVAGMRIGWRGPWYELGLHALNTQFEYPYIRKEMSHNHNYFRGQRLTQYAADYQFRAYHNILLGEFAIDDNLGFANLTSLQTQWNDSWQTSLLYHYYSNDYRQLHGSGIGENSEMQGEQGLTFNVSGELSKHWQILAMADWFSFGQPQYQTKSTPEDGYEGHIRGIYTSSKITMSLGYKVKSKIENLRHSIDGIFTITPNKKFVLKTQIRKRINHADETSSGFAIAQALGYKSSVSSKIAVNLETQAAYFDTDDYNSRIYINEKNLLYGFGYPMLYGQGVRYNLTANIKIASFCNIDLKYAISNYANKATISSALQEIKGNTQQDLWLQLRFAF